MNDSMRLLVPNPFFWTLVAIVTVFALTAALRWFEHRRARRLDAFVESHLAPRVVRGADQKARRPLRWLSSIGFAGLALTLLQPHWGQSYEEVSKRSHDILVCLDISESMLAESPPPTRLERAKQKIVSAMGRSFGDRFGLIAFSGAAELMCPLTLDHGYYRTVLNAVDTDSISLEGTDLEAALDVATATFEDLEANGDAGGRDNRAVLLISDGESVSGDAIAAAERLGELAHVFVMGVGDPRGTEVTYTNRFVQGDVQQQTHMSRLDEDNLQRIALAGAGAYIRSTSSNRDVDELYGAVEQLFARSVDSDIEQRLVNRYQIPLAIAVVCFMAEGVWRVLLPVRARRRAESAEEAGMEAADFA